MPGRDMESRVVLDADTLGEGGEVPRQTLFFRVVVKADVRSLEHRPFERLVLDLVLSESLRAGEGGRGERNRGEERDQRRAGQMHQNSGSGFAAARSAVTSSRARGP